MSNMKKERKTYKIGALLLVVCLISTVMLSGTFAKYVSEYSGQDTALGEDFNTAELARTKYGIKVTLTATQVTPEILE